MFAQNKRNSRPTDEDSKVQSSKKNNGNSSVYFYEFSQPKFIITHILIEHDEKGVGKVTFKKNDYEDDFTETLKLSEKTIEKLKTLWKEIDFLNSEEVYQSKERDYSHLGTIKIRMKKDEKERTSEFNWTENLSAKALADEYRKISNQAVWMFDMNVAKENQPLESPKIMNRIDSYLKRNEISDPQELKPFLKSVSDDERFPLITRNHATRLIKQIEKMDVEKQ